MNEPLSDLRIRDLLHVALERGASDIHLTPNAPVAIRVNGNLEMLPGVPKSAEIVDSMAGELLGSAAIARVRNGDEVTIARYDGDGRAFRLHGYRTSAGIVLAVRLLNSAVPTLEALALPSAVSHFAEQQHGLIVFSGPTGCGKTTSLAALVDRVNTRFARRVVTIEDPIEYRHASKASCISQREVGSDASSFESALRGALRADPDVILIGEIRDRATMREALAAAETGHLVLTTLHTTDAPGTVERIVDMFQGEEHGHVRSQLATVLSAVVCQQLVWTGSGEGRRAVAEVLIATDAVRATIRDGRIHQLRNCIATGRAFGMQTMESHVCELIASGEIDRDSGRRACGRPDEIDVLCGALP